MKGKLLSFGFTICAGLITAPVQVSVALPPPEEIPEEVLRNEIITEARSPIDNGPLTAAQYAELEAKIAQSPYPPELSTKLRELVFLLQLRKLFKTLIPF